MAQLTRYIHPVKTKRSKGLLHRARNHHCPLVRVVNPTSSIPFGEGQFGGWKPRSWTIHLCSATREANQWKLKKIEFHVFCSTTCLGEIIPQKLRQFHQFEGLSLAYHNAPFWGEELSPLPSASRNSFSAALLFFSRRFSRALICGENLETKLRGLPPTEWSIKLW